MYGYIAGDLDYKKLEWPESNDEIMPEAGKWIRCPDCGSSEAGFLYWGEGVDTSFSCPDCGASYQVR